jgi:lysozyme
MSQIDSHRLEEVLKRHEGLRLKPYRDTVGKLTIGIGRNLDDVGISEHEAEVLLGNDVNRAIIDCRKMFSNFKQLSSVRKEVLINMMFNMGYSTFSKFKHLKEAVENEQWKKAGYEMLNSKWYEQVGRRGRELREAFEKDSFVGVIEL